MTKANDGGMTGQQVDATEVSPAQKPDGYPSFFMAGIKREPTAEVPAMAEPDTVPNSIQASTSTMARPPLTWPTKDCAQATSRLVIPPLAMIFPARIKNGKEIITKMLIP